MRQGQSCTACLLVLATWYRAGAGHRPTQAHTVCLVPSAPDGSLSTWCVPACHQQGVVTWVLSTAAMTAGCAHVHSVVLVVGGGSIIRVVLRCYMAVLRPPQLACWLLMSSAVRPQGWQCTNCMCFKGWAGHVIEGLLCKQQAWDAPAAAVCMCLWTWIMSDAAGVTHLHSCAAGAELRLAARGSARAEQHRSDCMLAPLQVHR
jgi:hypothetical protein